MGFIIFTLYLIKEAITASYFPILKAQKNKIFIKDNCFKILNAKAEQSAVAGISEIIRATQDDEIVSKLMQQQNIVIPEAIQPFISSSDYTSLETVLKSLHEQTAINVRLTQQEKVCFYYLLEGRSSKQIARSLFISPRTVENHIYNIKKKFDCRTWLELLSRVRNCSF